MKIFIVSNNEIDHRRMKNYKWKSDLLLIKQFALTLKCI